MHPLPPLCKPGLFHKHHDTTSSSAAQFDTVLEIGIIFVGQGSLSLAEYISAAVPGVSVVPRGAKGDPRANRGKFS